MVPHPTRLTPHIHYAKQQRSQSSVNYWSLRGRCTLHILCDGQSLCYRSSSLKHHIRITVSSLCCKPIKDPQIRKHLKGRWRAQKLDHLLTHLQSHSQSRRLCPTLQPLLLQHRNLQCDPLGVPPGGLPSLLCSQGAAKALLTIL